MFQSFVIFMALIIVALAFGYGLCLWVHEDEKKALMRYVKEIEWENEKLTYLLKTYERLVGKISH